MTRPSFGNPGAIVTSDWLSRHINDPDLRIFDCTTHLEPAPRSDAPYRVVSGWNGYREAHIPGAGYLDLQRDFSQSDSPFAMTLADGARVAAAFGRAGIGDQTRVVLYSRNGLPWATRFWWMLRWLGFDRAAVLDGCFNSWVVGGHPVSEGIEGYGPETLSVTLRPSLFVGRDEVRAAIDDPSCCTVSALGHDVFTGETRRYGRAGRIPASVNVPQVSLIDPATDSFLSAGTIARIFSLAGVNADKSIVNYCGGGIFATLNAFLLHQLGYEDVAVYDNSMSEWGVDESLPIEVG